MAFDTNARMMKGRGCFLSEFRGQSSMLFNSKTGVYDSGEEFKDRSVRPMGMKRRLHHLRQLLGKTEKDQRKEQAVMETAKNICCIIRTLY